MSKSAYITVNGAKGKFLRNVAGGSVFVIPPLITNLTQTEYSLKSNEKIDLSNLIQFSDNSTGSTAEAFDNNYGTIYSSNSIECFVGFDVGEGLQAKVFKIRYFPNVKWLIASKYLLRAKF
jgi:hypothetical protein